MTSQKNNNPAGASEEKVVVASGGEGKPTASEASGRTDTFCGDLLRSNSIAQGVVWHEILSGPLCKRRRSK